VSSAKAAIGSAATTDTAAATAPAAGRADSFIAIKAPAKLGGKKNNTKQQPKKPKKGRKDFSIKRKLEILAEIRRKVTSQKAIIRREGTSKSAVNRWKLEENMMVKQMEEERRGAMKRQLKIDGLKQVREGLHKFYDLNDTMPKSLCIPLTRECYVFALFFLNAMNVCILNFS
jgi:hypothetical protein